MSSIEDPTLGPVWADVYGEDRYGVFAGVEVEGVEYRFRRIPMGEGVYGEGEEQRTVVLDQELWVGEVPCTQALWKAVTGAEPSYFGDSPERPVEQVSFEDCVAFLEELNAKKPELEARLPSELEWEFACRAGTEADTYAGPLDVLGDHNAPVLDAIAWYGGNSGVGFEHPAGVRSSGWAEKQYEHDQAGTREVGRKRPNRWGLYDTLGNVWEGCADEFQGGPKRVLRGGSWYDYARDVRAAYRGAFSPASRFRSIGVRLARGQGFVREPGGAEGESPAEGRGEER